MNINNREITTYWQGELAGIFNKMNSTIRLKEGELEHLAKEVLQASKKLDELINSGKFTQSQIGFKSNNEKNNYLKSIIDKKRLKLAVDFLRCAKGRASIRYTQDVNSSYTSGEIEFYLGRDEGKWLWTTLYNERPSKDFSTAVDMIMGEWGIET